MKQADIMQLHAAYWKAESALAKSRNELFPVGSKVRSIMTNTEATIIEGSLYADQVNTTAGHMGWISLTDMIIKEQNHDNTK